MSSNQAQVLQSLLSFKEVKLYGLKDIGTSRTWDFSMPTICRHRGFTDRHNFASDKSFFDIFEKDVNQGLPYQILKNAGVFENNNSIVLFGGCVLDIILKKHYSIKDFDLRIVGEEYMNDEAKCISKAKDFVASIFSFLTEKNEEFERRKREVVESGGVIAHAKCDLQEIVVSRCRSTVTVQIPSHGGLADIIFQLTFAPCRTVEEMLAACQPQCTRLAIKDGAVVLDGIARFCIESACIVLDVSSFLNYYQDDKETEDDEEMRKTTSGRTITIQIHRFIKYFDEKGFDLILPELDMQKVQRRNLEYGVVEVLALPSMTVAYDEVKNNVIMATWVTLAKHLKSKVEENVGAIGVYGSSTVENVGESIHHNIRCLVHDIYDSFKYVAKGERYEHVFDFVPTLSPRMVTKSYETVTDELTNENIPIERILGYFSVTPSYKVVEKLISDPIKKQSCGKGKFPQQFQLDKDILNGLVDKEIKALLLKIEHLRETLIEKKLNRLVLQYPENVTTVEEIREAFYGNSCKA
mmetsp:Transcript_3436/g.7277  ORF Transcript_3436/g.7277 Transcript_3436/m.7277 type:complete len:524 (+) Transcript_3436:98-1669(+)